ncbi:DivIVA domain-containing protein [Desulfuromonas versatilis]|uniref:DivIVA domain-containing protein n=1 Tax=Desulfuromonas versatilis TaxID=2802975 RepID=A0ABM8HVA9_9BACT|nr:DivIVA domain-containing protein [Desulfuromonas versatilis]BCR05929.1 DivIVA domain-containing protein [Desulfuromonas versatilis]
MRITPIDIQQHQFRTRPLGYEKAGVDHYLELLADELALLHKQSQELKEELARTRSALEEMRQREATLKETLLTTQRMTDDLKNNARKEAETILAQARLRAERIVRDAEDRRIQLIGEVQEVKRQKVSFEASLRALLESHVRMLDMKVVRLPERDAEPTLLEESLPFEDADAEGGRGGEKG